jgi:hypothetical protein
MNKFKTRSFFFVSFLICIILIVSSFRTNLFAESVNMSVTVGNDAPYFTTAPYESVASDGTTPTNIGSNVIFWASATDSNNNSYYLLICKNGNAPTPGNMSAPECNGGLTNRLCRSFLPFASGTLNSCLRSTSGDTAVETMDWYAFVCDYNAGSLCSAAAQGSGPNGSPYYINHRPTFPTAPVQPQINPGGTAIFTVLSANWGDTDSNPTQDTGKLLVCASSGITAAGFCSGTELCASSLTAPGNNLSCSYNDSGNPVKAAGVYSAYTYIVDNHNFAASGVGQGANVGYLINNVSPVITNIIINGGSIISLEANATVPIVITALISDQNGCQNLATNPVSLKFYRSGIGVSGCTENNSSCTIVPSTSCSVAITNPNTCTGATDPDVKYTCDLDLDYYTDPTDGDALTNPYYANDWRSTVTAVDFASSSGSSESTSNVDVESMNAIQMTSSIDYGNLGPAIASGGGIINMPVTVTNVGNVGLDLEAKGGVGSDPSTTTGLSCLSGGCSGSEILYSQQKWEYSNNTTTWNLGTNSLTTSLVSIPIDINKPTSSAHPTSKDLYWGLLIPAGQAYGTYTGSNTINSKLSAPGNW